ncbi:MAG: DUF1638 domain-containing protein [Deltaproteobacteria bacterium]|nr:DUF1638 domain-containing protein [Deltaproteobacteria bacterium]
MSKNLGIVACDVMHNELIKVLDGREDVPLKFLDYALHGTPKEMPGKINEAVQEMILSGCERVALGYCLCSNGSVGVYSSKGGLVMPRCHDCISMLLGSAEKYFKMFNQYPGTFFVTDGWFRNGADPLSTVETRYIPRLGEKKAFKGMKMELLNYKYICLVNNGVGDIPFMRARTQENCRVFQKEYLEVEADLSFFQALIDGPHPEKDFVVLGPNEKVNEAAFYNGNPLEALKAS